MLSLIDFSEVVQRPDGRFRRGMGHRAGVLPYRYGGNTYAKQRNCCHGKCRYHPAWSVEREYHGRENNRKTEPTVVRLKSPWTDDTSTSARLDALEFSLRHFIQYILVDILVTI